MPPQIDGGLLGSDYKPRARNALSGRFIVPPFSVLNAREGWWQARKRAWIGLGIRSELGRGENLLKFSDSVMAAQQGQAWGKDGKKRNAKIEGEAQAGRATKKVGKSVYLLPADEEGEGVLTGTSIFDPVLCEISYRWYCPEGGRVLDPFSGGSVRGIVAGELGLYYTGVDLSEKQIKANRQQAKEIGTKPSPRWLVGDSRHIVRLHQNAALEKTDPRVGTLEYDFIFSCPPYGDLEQYSDDPLDISNMSATNFSEAYRDVIVKSCSLLKPGRFACFIVGDYRGDDGFYSHLPEQTVMNFEEAGLRLYNRAILCTSVGSLPMRVNKMFSGSRKLGPTHQYVFVFAKGNPKKFLPTWSGNLLERWIK